MIVRPSFEAEPKFHRSIRCRGEPEHQTSFDLDGLSVQSVRHEFPLTQRLLDALRR
jgi:hypothetical protein